MIGQREGEGEGGEVRRRLAKEGAKFQNEARELRVVAPPPPVVVVIHHPLIIGANNDTRSIRMF